MGKKSNARALSPADFERALARTRIKDRAGEVARLVLVDGLGLAEAGRAHGVTRQAAAAAVARVMRAARPADWRRVSVILPASAIAEVREIERRELQRVGLATD